MKVFAMVCAGLMCGGAVAQAHTSVEFTMRSRVPGEKPWTIKLDRDGAGTYRVEGADAVPVHVSEATWAKIDGANAAVDEHRCETKEKNIAQTGLKTIVFGVGDVVASCTFNYSDDEALNVAAADFAAIAETMRMGEKLRMKKRFDRLGLDEELDLLLAEAKSGRAMELGNIEVVLRGILEDDEMMTMVRKKAATLLAMGK